MGKLSNQQATFKEQRITVSHKSEYVMSFFSGDMPNMFYVRNESIHTAYVSLTKMPTPTNFEFKISGNSSDIVGRPSSTSRLYIYNDSDEDINIYVISVNDIFNLEFLKNLKVSLDNEVAELIKFDGIIKGFESPLPSGVNKIGVVGVENWADLQGIATDVTSLVSDNIDIKSKFDSLITAVQAINVNVTKPLNILTSAWVSNTSYSGYNYRATIADASVTTAKDVDVAFDMASIGVAQTAVVGGATVMYNGGFYLYAQNVPSATLTGTYTIKAVI